MVKTIFVLYLAVLVFISDSFSQSNNSGVLLYSQTGLVSNQVAISSLV